MRSDGLAAEAVYRARHPWIASYAARTQNSNRGWLRTWEEAVVGIGIPVAAVFAAGSLQMPAVLMLPSVIVSVVLVVLMRILAGRAVTGRILIPGKAIASLATSGNDDLIDAAIDPVIRFDSDPAGAAALVDELRDAWAAAEASTANEKASIIAALRATAANFPTTDEAVRQVRGELAVMRRSLEALDTAQRALDATTSTAAMADPPAPPASLGLLRAAAESIAEDARLVSEVADETRRQLDQA
ncbi:hypothetical protein G7085_07030 [Tessaracoccus sp. HDW20]|uniref:hypothetical protein n=1 Tax=Tessaracoccus coleopterorum TaxID=2714950 RepID=UPI0018D3FE45|nr:hypothetical protein [Tessaracoccus coleopterorum]NHB84442.1 hypothetical protein [Tessaracoccus coleopterorum]